jgi:DNA-binding MltR family transcriptional regulator
MGGKKKMEPRPARPPFEGVVLELAQQLALESDRGCVLVALAAVDEAIERLLRAFVRKVSAPRNHTDDVDFLLTKEPVPPLGSLGVRLHLCHALGLLDDPLFSILLKMSKMRNEFAHPSQPVELTNDDLPFGVNFAVPDNDQMRAFLEAQKAYNERLLPHSDAKAFSDARHKYMLQAQFVHAKIVSTEMMLEDLSLPLPIPTVGPKKKRPNAGPESPQAPPA